MSTAQLEALTTTQAAGLVGAQVAAITSAQVSGHSDKCDHTCQRFPEMNGNGSPGLTATQIAALSTSRVSSMNFGALQYLASSAWSAFYLLRNLRQSRRPN